MIDIESSLIRLPMFVTSADIFVCLRRQQMLRQSPIRIKASYGKP